MCIIVSKEKGIKMPSKEILERCFEANPDGAGFMYEKNGLVQIRKGFMSFEEFYFNIQKLERICGDLTNVPLVMHFRISTAGKVDKGNCHPYPILDNDKALRSLNYSASLGMAHNGIILGYNDPKKVLNDTQMFIKNVVSTFYDYDKDFLNKEKVVDILEDIAGSKLCFLNEKGEITYVGDFIEDEGVKYSNSTYLKRNLYPMWDYGYAGGYGGYNYDVQDCGYYDYFYELLEKVEANKELYPDEFYVLIDGLSFLERDDFILLKNDDILEVGSNSYAIDDFNSLYLVNYDNESIKLVDVDVEVVDKETLQNMIE